MTWTNIKWSLAIVLCCLVCYFRAAPEEQVVNFAIGQIRGRYFQELRTRELVEGALEGCVSRLDRYSQYYDARAVARLNEEIDRQFAGIGIEIQPDPETKDLVVTSPLPDSPALRAGIKAGDCLLAVDGRSLSGISVEEAAQLLRGSPGSQVRLTIRPFESEATTELTLTRAVIRVSTILGDRRRPDGTWDYFLESPSDPRLAYVRISSFAPETATELERLLADLSGQGMRGLVLDLRNDPGGLLGPAVAVCDLFIPSGIIVTTRGRGGAIRAAFRATGRAKFRDLPLVVLINQETASAAEIVAACLQDHHRAVLVGQRTYGKGTVQELISLGARYGVLKVTTATYWRPSNRDINRRPGAGEDEPWGVQPDPGFEIKLEAEQFRKLVRERALRDIARPELAARWRRILARSETGEPGKSQGENQLAVWPEVDPQLKRAIDYLTELIRQQEGQTLARRAEEGGDSKGPAGAAQAGSLGT